MQNTDQNISIIETGTLTDRQARQIRQLTDICRRHDHIQLSYPIGESDTADADGARHWLCCQNDGLLCCALGLVYYQDSLAECIAFTHPDFRRRGLFSLLLEQALAHCEDCDILFTVSGCCPDTLAVLESLEAELQSQEYRMELELESVSDVQTLPPLQEACALHQISETEHGKTSGSETTWQLISSDGMSGTCQTSMVSDSCACLHHVEILPSLRGQGYGYALLCLLLPALYEEGVRRLILQVSGDTRAALALYKKTGFRITETLSCYLY